MKLSVFLLAVSLILAAFKPHREINLYDSSGNATAYIDDYLSDQVITCGWQP